MEIILSRFGADVCIEEPLFIHESVCIYGKTRICKGVSIWPRVVMRAESFENFIGEYSNLQDFVMVHVGSHQGTVVGTYSTIGHRATLHGCTVGNNCLIGINATLMDNVILGDNSIVAGHTIITEGTTIPPNSIVAGIPGKVIKTKNNFIPNRVNALNYLRNGKAYSEANYRSWEGESAIKNMDLERKEIIEEFKKLYPDQETA